MLVGNESKKATVFFVMQKFKKYLKNFCHDQQRWGGGQFFDFMGGDTAVMRGDIELMPPTRENPGVLIRIITVKLL